MTNIDSNQIAAAIVTDLTKSFLKGLKEKSLDFLSKKYAIFAADFDQYLSSTYQKCNFIRTVITKDRPYEIKKIYVDGYFKCANNIIQDRELSQLIRDNIRVVVTGFGGIGKTVFAKRFWINVFEEPHGRIPVFFELRRLNNLTSPDIESIVRNSLFPSASANRDEIFKEFLESGRFIFILDALDEVTDEKKGSIEEQILSLSFKYPKCGFLVTSRYEARFESWEQFHVYKAEAFNQAQVKELIDNIDFDPSIKKKFKAEVVEKQFDKHKSFSIHAAFKPHDAHDVQSTRRTSRKNSYILSICFSYSIFLARRVKRGLSSGKEERANNRSIRKGFFYILYVILLRLRAYI